MRLELSQAEAGIVGTIVRDRMSSLLHEIARADARAYREQLQREYELLEHLDQRLNTYSAEEGVTDAPA